MISDMDARPWDFQAEECALRACVDRFNNRRYNTSAMVNMISYSIINKFKWMPRKLCVFYY
jgi:hypothetical protein